MAMSLSRGLDPQAVWDLLHSGVVGESSMGALIKGRVRRNLNFFDDFNRTLVDPDVWTSGGDVGGAFSDIQFVGHPTQWRIYTGNGINDDWYIHGDGVIYNKVFCVLEHERSIVIWEARVRLESVAAISALWGLFNSVQTGYAEPASRCAQFFADVAITNTVRVRTYDGVEEETDTLVALDTDWHTYRIEWEAAVVRFYIDEVLVATHAVNVPDQPMFTEFLIRTEAAATKYMGIDFNCVEVY